MTCSFCCTCCHRAFRQHVPLVQHRDAVGDLARRSPCRARRRRACNPPPATGRARRCASSRRRSCRRPARRAAGAAAPASAACRSRATASGRATAAPRAAPLRWPSLIVSRIVSDAIARRGVELRASAWATRACRPCAASSRFSNTVWSVNTVGFWNLRPMPTIGDLGLGEPREVDRLAEERGALVGPRLAGDHVHHRGLARAVGSDHAAQLARIDDQGEVVERLEAVEADRDAVEVEDAAVATCRRPSSRRGRR